MIKLSERLSKIADLVDDHAKIVDIGCDHGLLDIYLYQTKKNIKIIASDVNENALSNAINNINKYNLTGKIEVVLSDGLDNIPKEKIDTIVISGMGANTIMEILYKGRDKLDKVNTIIIQSNNKEKELRKYITSLGYYIIDEYLVKDKNIIYTIIKFSRGKIKYSYFELEYGPILITKKDSLLKEKIKKTINKNKIILKKIPKNKISMRIKLFLKIKKQMILSNKL